MLQKDDLDEVPTLVKKGKITSVQGNKIRGRFPTPAIGQTVMIPIYNRQVLAHISSFTEHEITLTPFEPIKGLRPGTPIWSSTSNTKRYLTKNHVGSIVNALGEVHTSPKHFISETAIKNTYIPSDERKKISQPITKFIKTGVSSIDAFLSLGAGQRIVLLAEPGIGKSSLLLRITEKSDFDLVIFALIGERGREVQELHYKIQETSANEKSIIVASTSDESPLMRVEAVHTAMAYAEAAAAQGLHVLLAFDSLTRYVRSLRDVALSTGELPIRRGYPASIFENVPKLIERAGNFSQGSITAIYTMLTSSHLDEDPFIEEVKGLTDGHIYLSKELSERGIYPAVDIRKSLSRVHTRLWDDETCLKLNVIKKIYSEICEKTDLLLLANQEDALDYNKKILDKIEHFLALKDTVYDKAQLRDMITTLYADITQA